MPENQHEAENSASYQKEEKQNTRLTKQEALEILESAITICRRAGVSIEHYERDGVLFLQIG